MENPLKEVFSKDKKLDHGEGKELKAARHEHKLRAKYRKAQLQGGASRLKLISDWVHGEGIEVTEKDIAYDEAKKMDHAINKELEKGSTLQEAIEIVSNLPSLKTTDEDWLIRNRETQIENTKYTVEDLEEVLKKGDLGAFAEYLNNLLALNITGYYQPDDPEYWAWRLDTDDDGLIAPQANATAMFSKELTDVAVQGSRKILAANDIHAYVRLVANNIENGTDVVDFNKEIFPIFNQSKEFKEAVGEYLTSVFKNNWNKPQNFLQALKAFDDGQRAVISMNQLKESDVFKKMFAELSENGVESWYSLVTR